MSVKTMGSKLAQGVRRVKSQQGQSKPSAAFTPQPLPAAVPTEGISKKTKPVVKRSAPQPAHKTVPTGSKQGSGFGGPQEDDRVWPD